MTGTRFAPSFKIDTCLQKEEEFRPTIKIKAITD